jgi:predicted nucleotide-binding protein (sugar kinase/HSP70/actin superfamily)
MRVTFPHMGTLHIPVRAMLAALGVDVVLAPPSGAETVSIGARHAPEFACFPLKLNLGNFVQAHALGADTILMAGGVGPCRFGYYAQVQREILRDLGCQYDMIVLEPPRGHLAELLHQLRELVGRRSLAEVWRAVGLAWEKFLALDAVDAAAMRVRAREARRGETSRAWRLCLEWIDDAPDRAAVRQARDRGLAALGRVGQRDAAAALRVGIVGEVFMVLEPAANLGVAERLGEMGVEVHRSVMLSDWIRTHLFLDALRLRRGDDPVRRAARPYLDHFVGGEGRDTVGHTVLYAGAGYDGVVHVLPFTCMPEIVAKSILPRVTAAHDIPVLSLVLDEHAAEGGVLTRLEAFVDVLWQRRAAAGVVGR